MSLNVSLGELEGYVREKVTQGEYRSTEEVLCEGVRLLQQREERWKATVREKIEEGLKEAREGKLIPGEEAFARVFAWLGEQEASGGK